MILEPSQKTKVLMYCGNGYVFDEIFYPLIKLNSTKWNIDLLMADYYLSGVIKKKVDELLDASVINRYSIISNSCNSISSFLMLRKSLQLFNEAYSFFITGSDYSVLDRVMIDHVKKNDQSKVIIIQTGTIWRVEQCYQNMLQAEKNSSKSKSVVDVSKYKYIVDILDKIWRNRLRINRILYNFIKRKYNSLMSHYILPFMVYKKTYKPNLYDQYAFSSGLSDAVVLFNKTSAKALKKCVPIISDVFVAKHPLRNLSDAYRLDTHNQRNDRILLVCFAQNLNDELSDENFENWISIIVQVAKLANMNEVHIRCHPRTSTNVQWPNSIISRIKQCDFKVSLIDPLAVNLIDSIPIYSGIIGAPSGSLIVARSVADNDVFISCIPDCSSGSPDDQFWAMGGADGINCIDKNKSITKEDIRCMNRSNREMMSVLEVIDQKVSLVHKRANIF